MLTGVRSIVMLIGLAHERSEVSDARERLALRSFTLTSFGSG
jgi:hypothetical protein